MLDLDAFRRALAVACAASPDWQRPDAVAIADRIDSTNTALAARARDARRGPRLVLVAREQTAGRGRHGRHWVAVPGAALALSIGLELPLALSALHGLTLVCGLAVRDALADLGATVALKWPNDVVDIQTRAKLGGLLVEAQPLDANASWVVVGIGLNLCPAPALAALGGADLATLARGDLDDNVLAARLVMHVEARVQRFVAEGFAPCAAEFDRAHAFHGHGVELRHDGRVIAHGRFEGVTARGEVQLRDATGAVRVLMSGDLSLRADATA